MLRAALHKATAGASLLPRRTTRIGGFVDKHRFTDGAAIVRACGIPWCVALADDFMVGVAAARCTVHREHELLRLLELAPDEELVDGVYGKCGDCHGSGDCDECGGDGECGDQCGSGHRCAHECEACSGSGRCPACGGSGFGGVRKRAA